MLGGLDKFKFCFVVWKENTFIRVQSAKKINEPPWFVERLNSFLMCSVAEAECE